VRVDTWPIEEGGLRKFYENRFYQELLIKSKWGKFKVSHRFRLEQRWITTPEYGKEYSNRGRYMLGFIYALGGSPNYLALVNEIFVDFDAGDYWFNLEGAEAGLNQNRVLLAIGRQFTPVSKLQLGVMWQYRPKADFWRLVLGFPPKA